MVFNSFNFWLVFPIIFAIYWLIPKRQNQVRKIWLILVSYLLYLNWKPAYGLVLLGVTMVTFWGGHFFDSQPDINKKRRLVWLFCLIGFLPLLVFKYYNFLNESIQAGLSTIGLRFTMPGLNWAVPIGISFYTFQAVGYMLDVYHKRIKAEKNLLDYILFVSYFPQVLSGPISKGCEFLPQLKQSRSFNYDQSVVGLQYLLWGMFLKLVVADRLGMYVDTVFTNYHYYSGATCFLASIFYSFQIYTDFAGYSLMAVGLSKTLGIDIIKNFRQPYFSISITDFWRRWHISLSRWLKDYVYIPLGGSRCSKILCYRNILITFLVSGIWHGANWTFIVWGIGHGLFQIVEKAVEWGKNNKNIYRDLPRILFTFLIVNFLWILFRVSTIGDFGGFVNRIIFHLFDGEYLKNYLYFNIFLIFSVLIKDILSERGEIHLLYKSRIFRWCLHLIIFIIILLYGVLDSSQFIYVSF